MSVSVKCSNCGADVVFDADKQQMYCEHCGTLVKPEELKQDLTPEDNPQWHAEKKDWEDGASQYTCGNCGAAVVTDRDTSATFCAFCGSPTIIPERLVDAYRPSVLIPFQYGREEALKSFFAWCRKGRLTPRDFVSEKNVEKLTGLYLPFWLFDIDVDMRFAATGVKVDRVTIGNTITTTTSYFDIVRNRKMAWDRIPLDGATRVDDALMEILEPFSYERLVDFDMKYLSGFYAEKYDLKEEDLYQRLKDRVAQYAREEFDGSVTEYSRVTDVVDKSVYYTPKNAYALLPVWMMNYTYRGKLYTFAMNGQTGKVAGEPPVSPIKVALICAATLLLSSGLFYLVGGLFR